LYGDADATYGEGVVLLVIVGTMPTNPRLLGDDGLLADDDEDDELMDMVLDDDKDDSLVLDVELEDDLDRLLLPHPPRTAPSSAVGFPGESYLTYRPASPRSAFPLSAKNPIVSTSLRTTQRSAPSNVTRHMTVG
jgi:hypothetical protein